eukprot:gene6407-10414_t
MYETEIDISDMYEDEIEEFEQPTFFPFETNPENILSLFLANMNKKKFIFTRYFKDKFTIKINGKIQKDSEFVLKNIFLDKSSLFFTQNNIYQKEKYEKVHHVGKIQQFETIHGQLIRVYEIRDSLIFDSKEGWKIDNLELETIFEDSKACERKNLGMTEKQHESYTLNKKKPKRIFLIRSGESEKDKDIKIYETVPDNKIKLSNLGVKQSIVCGNNLKKLIGNESVYFYVSPFQRSIETFENISKAFGGKKKLNYRLDPRLREQEWGNYQNVEDRKQFEEQRRILGAFYYRFATGESGADVAERVVTFIDNFHRTHSEKNEFENVVLVTHGLTCRLFLMKWFHWDVDIFHNLYNFDNGQYAIMEKQKDTGKYKLITPLKANISCFPPSKDFNLPKNLNDKLSIKDGTEKMLKESFSPRVDKLNYDPFEQFL